jgi:eukaryotic-like serine/threonine-protein kinase
MELNREEKSEGALGDSVVGSHEELVDRLNSFWDNKGPSHKRYEPFETFDVGPYAIQQQIGAGAFGLVYRAIDSRDNRTVAIKLLRPELCKDNNALERLLREYQAQSRLSHPSIVKILDADMSATIPYLVSEYCEGPNLSDWLARQAIPFTDVRAAIRLILGLVKGISFAHLHGIIHRDIKPTNILVVNEKDTSDGVNLALRLTDFGLVKLVDMPLCKSSSNLIVGTPVYMAPEQLLRKWGPTSARTDIYAIGVVLYEIFEKHPPRHGKDYSDIMLSLLQDSSPTQLVWSLSTPESVRQIIKRCLEVDPADRYPNAQSLAEDLETIGNGQPIQKPFLSFLKPLKRWLQQTRRTAEAYAFLLPMNIILFVGMMCSAAAIAGPLYPGHTRTSDLIQCFAIGFGIVLSSIALCILRIRGHRWATLAILLIVFPGHIVLPLLALLGTVRTFDGLYANAPFFQVLNHSIVLSIGLMECIFLGISYYADQHESSRKSQLSKQQVNE